jgi:hypothetical protein
MHGQKNIFKNEEKLCCTFCVLLQPRQSRSVAKVVNWMPHASFCVVQHAKLLVPGQTIGAFV